MVYRYFIIENERDLERATKYLAARNRRRNVKFVSKLVIYFGLSYLLVDFITSIF